MNFQGSVGRNPMWITALWYYFGFYWDGLLPVNLILCAKIRTYEKDDRYQPTAYFRVLSYSAITDLGVDDF
jgi:hypothetical protein